MLVPGSVTHTAPKPTTTHFGFVPTRMVATTLFVAGSIRETVPSPELATHTDPAPTATCSGTAPTVIVATT